MRDDPKLVDSYELYCWLKQYLAGLITEVKLGRFK